MFVSNVDLGKRRFLTATTSAVGGVGAAFVAWPFLASMQPSAKAKAAGAPVEVDISKIQPGQMLTVEWRGKPVWIVQRPKEALDNLATLGTDILRDPDSAEEQQPAYAKNTNRSIREDILVAVGICTHLGCAPTYRPEVGPADLGADWKGGFFCPCHGSKFDLSGRVYQSVPAPLNLAVPPHSYLSDTRIIVGVDKGEA